ncbi:MAG: SAVED domain-containing protein [Acholeplasma sp.]|nr:SAVED domain-containing protein [Acholeplasma sp.]
MSSIYFKEVFECFEVHEFNDNNCFVHVSIYDKATLFQSIFDYFFSEDTFFRHFNYRNDFPFTPERKNYVELYRNLKRYLDEDTVEMLIKSIDEDEIALLESEDMISRKDEGIFLIRNDKVGKIGEYFLSIILERYFNFTCIIPKIILNTNPHMSTYGIDALYYDKKRDLLAFGEAKLVKNLSSGINLINKSLTNYHEMLENEYILISNREIASISNVLSTKYENELGLALNFGQFIVEANIKEIMIPLFITNGVEFDAEKILPELDKNINKKDFFSLTTTYLVVSLPIIDKNELLEFLTLKINDKVHAYESEIRI